VLDGLLAEMLYVPGVFDDDSVYAEIDRALRECDDQAGEPLNASSTCRPHRSSSG
jgi:hypothetical protein